MATVTDKAIEVVKKFLRQLKATDIKVEMLFTAVRCLRSGWRHELLPCQLSSVIPACRESKRDMIPDVAGMTILRHNKVDMTINRFCLSKQTWPPLFNPGFYVFF